MVTSAARVDEYDKNRTVSKAAIEKEANTTIPDEINQKQPKKEYKTAHELGFYLS